MKLYTSTNSNIYYISALKKGMKVLLLNNFY